MGTDYTNACTLDLLALASTHEALAEGPVFMDLFFVDGIDASESAAAPTPGSEASAADALLIQQLGGRPILFPIPLVVQNVADNAVPGRDASVLTRRMFLFDTVLGRPAGAVLPEWGQYAESITIHIRVRSSPEAASAGCNSTTGKPACAGS